MNAKHITSLLYIVLLFTLLPVSKCYSQKSLDPDSLTVGKTYKIILFDDTEIIGKVAAVDSTYIQIKSDDGYRKISKDDIFFVSGNATPKVWNAILSIRSGYTILLSSKYNNKTKSFGACNISVEGVFPVKENSGIRFDLQYNRIFMDRVNYGAGYFENDDVNMFSISGDFLLGNFRSNSQFYYYINMGGGFHVTDEGTKTQYYYNSQNILVSSSYDSNPDISLFLNAGGTAGIKISKRFGAFFHVQINTFSSDGGFLFFWGEANLPLSAGISYFF
jgi:hypothetical protein